MPLASWQRRSAASLSASPTATLALEPRSRRTRWAGTAIWILSHQCINLLMRGIAAEARKKKIAVVALMPGFMRTERVVRLLATTS